jgi:hypothetical protein
MKKNTKNDKISTHFYCGYCGTFLPRSAFSPNSTRNVCRKHSTIYDRYRADELKRTVIKQLGGKCISCGYDKCIASLDLHHPNPSIKDGSWDTLRKRSLQFILKHIKDQKLQLLCANCHREKHYIPVQKLEYKSQSLPKTSS